MAELLSNAPSPKKLGWAIVTRILCFLLLAGSIDWVLKHSSTQIYETSQPAGFAKGVLHGAIMPLAMPSLITGHDVPIYSPLNTGRTYKLGYTLGVNGCGLLFFGFFFWRVGRLRKFLA